MPGSLFGNIFRVSTWGESHGKALGVVVDGCPAGLALSEEDIQPYMDRRKPGQSALTTARKEGDEIQILSGVFEGVTTGTPISMMVMNTDQRSKDYGEISEIYRPGHADFGFSAKYGIRDYRGGGRSSARETLARVAAGAIAAKILKGLGMEVTAYTHSIGDVTIDPSNFEKSAIYETATCMPDRDADRKACELVADLRSKGDSVGGSVKCIISGAFPGLGEPVFDKLDAMLGGAMFSIGAVKAVEIGDGIKASGMRGSCNNDPFTADPSSGDITTSSNHAGGILGGISNGNDIELHVYFKPTPSISIPQETVDINGVPRTVTIKGRHDPVVVPRAVVVVEAMAALVMLDAYLMNMGSRYEYLENFNNNRPNPGKI